MPDEVQSMKEKYSILKDSNSWAEEISFIFRRGSQERTLYKEDI